MSSKLCATCVAILVLWMGCGRGVIDINEQEAFEPKIVIQGWLFPNQPVTNIKIMRNFPLNTFIDGSDVLIPNADVILRDESGRMSFRLRYNSNNGCYEYTQHDLVIEYGRSYTLEVKAQIEGRDLFASSTTTVPNPGFRVLIEESELGTKPYRQRDENGQLQNFTVTFDRSPGTDFYALSIIALDASIPSFIYDNPFGDFKEDDVAKDFDDFKYIYTWVQDTPLDAGKTSIDVLWFFTWFYGNYQGVVYAADRNFKDFLLTHNDVQEIDGNFHEPTLHIDGDGIGVFGSAIADTVFFSVVQ